jgi:rhamnosyl/mannosyltransferase
MQTLWQNPELAAEMGRKAEQRYWELFTADKMVASYVDLYKELIGNEKR